MKEKTLFFIKNLKLTKNNTFYNMFCNRIFAYYRTLPIFYKRLVFLNLWLIFSGKVFSTILQFPILKTCQKSSNVVIFQKECFFLKYSFKDDSY